MHYLFYRQKHSIICPVVHNVKTQNLQAILTCSTFSNTLQHNDENNGIMLACLLQPDMVRSYSNRDWAKTQLQLKKLLRFSIVSWATEVGGFFVNNIAEPIFNLLHHLIISYRTNLILERKNLKQEHIPSHLQTQTANENTNTVTCKTPAMVHDLLTHTNSTDHLFPHFCWRLPSTESSEANCTTTPSSIPIAFISNFT